MPQPCLRAAGIRAIANASMPGSGSPQSSTHSISPPTLICCWTPLAKSCHGVCAYDTSMIVDDRAFVRMSSQIPKFVSVSPSCSLLLSLSSHSVFLSLSLDLSLGLSPRMSRFVCFCEGMEWGTFDLAIACKPCHVSHLPAVPFAFCNNLYHVYPVCLLFKKLMEPADSPGSLGVKQTRVSGEPTAQPCLASFSQPRNAIAWLPAAGRQMTPPHPRIIRA